MAINPENPTQVRLLFGAVKAAHRKLEGPRNARQELIKEYVGKVHGDSGDGAQEMPVNMLALMVDVYLMTLAGNTPQVILPTPRQDLLPYIADLEAIVNQELQDMRLGKTIRRWVQEAIFSMGVLKSGLVDSEYIEILPGEPQPLQEYFAEVVDFDDFVYDVDAKSWDKIGFIGDRYVVDYDAIIDSDAYDPAGKRFLKIREEAYDEEIRASSLIISEEPEALSESWRKTCYLWDICLPEQGIILTLADSHDTSVPLKVSEWTWPSTSPYKTLWFTDVPGNTMPLPPGQVLKSLNKSLNALYRKLVEQAKRQKTLGLFRHGESDDAERIQKANDGDLVPVSHPDSVKEIAFGGAAQENLAFAITIRDLFSMLAGNLDAMGGLGPQADTARQDAMIQSQVSQKSAKMAEAVVDATTELIRDIVHHIWNDPIRSYHAQRQIAGTEVFVQADLSPGERFGNFEDFDIKIEPYSMTYRSPNARASEMVQLLTQVAFPMLPFLQQQGIGINIQRLFEYLSKYMSLPELQHIFEFIQPPLPGSSGQESRQPQVSHRTYERVNRPGATRAGNDRTMAQLLMGGNPQQSQVAALGRPTGV